MMRDITQFIIITFLTDVDVLQKFAVTSKTASKMIDGYSCKQMYHILIAVYRPQLRFPKISGSLSDFYVATKRLPPSRLSHFRTIDLTIDNDDYNFRCIPEGVTEVNVTGHNFFSTSYLPSTVVKVNLLSFHGVVAGYNETVKSVRMYGYKALTIIKVFPNIEIMDVFWYDNQPFNVNIPRSVKCLISNMWPLTIPLHLEELHVNCLYADAKTPELPLNVKVFLDGVWINEIAYKEHDKFNIIETTVGKKRKHLE